jgi:hypothetical protein
MRVSRLRPREEQVAELTCGQRLPLAPLHEIHLMFIAEVLTRAWEDLLSRRRATLLSGEEIEVNALMETRLIALLDEDERWSQLVRCVARGKETLSYDGSSLEKQPDLSIYLTNRSPSFPLVVECKLIDAPSRKRIALYCNDGLTRFVRGDYAWAVRESFMLAYVRDGSTISSCLVPFLAQGRAKQPDIYRTETLPELTGNAAMALAHSSHNRDFRYIGRQQNSPGAISVWHLWNSVRTEQEKR